MHSYDKHAVKSYVYKYIVKYLYIWFIIYYIIYIYFCSFFWRNFQQLFVIDIASIIIIIHKKSEVWKKRVFTRPCLPTEKLRRCVRGNKGRHFRIINR